jgi:hypothetical protein
MTGFFSEAGRLRQGRAGCGVSGWMKTTLFACLLMALSLEAADWPRFRGPNADGKAVGPDLPLDWGARENLVWRTELPGPGSSSPVVSGDRVFLTCYSGYGLDAREPGDAGKLRRHALCLDRSTGRILWQHEIESPVPDKPYTGHYITTHGYASGSAVTDGTGVFFFRPRRGACLHHGRSQGLGEERWGEGA